MIGEWTTYNRSAAAMYRYLDRETIAERRSKNCKRFFRRLESPALKRFCSALKYEMEHDPECHEWNISKKVCSLLEIGARQYERLRYEALLTL